MNDIHTNGFDPCADYCRVQPGMAVSVKDILDTGIVPASVGKSTPYSNESSTDEIGRYISDKIDGVMAAKALGQSLAYAPNNEGSPE